MWVNGSDPQWQATLERSQARGDLAYRPHVARFREDGLLEFAVRSLLSAKALLRSVRHIYLVTAGQVPVWLEPYLGSPQRLVRRN